MFVSETGRAGAPASFTITAAATCFEGLFSSLNFVFPACSLMTLNMCGVTEADRTVPMETEHKSSGGFFSHCLRLL